MSFTCGPPVSSSGGGASGKETYFPSVGRDRAIERRFSLTLRVAVELDTAHSNLLCIGQVATQDANARIHNLRLEVLHLRIEYRKVRRDI